MGKEEENQVEKFYESLKEQDRVIVGDTVKRMKEAGFEVYVTGSSLETREYADIDILVTPGKDSQMTFSDSIGKLESVVKNLPDVKVVAVEQMNVERLADFKSCRKEETYMGSKFLRRNKVELRNQYEGEGPTYQASSVLAREIFEVYARDYARSTKLDIVLTDNPFGVIPEIKRIKL